jgi:cell shape-determining protein MreC
MDAELKQWLIALIPALVPTLAVLLAMLQNNRSIDSLRREMESRFGSVDRRFDSVDRRFDSVNQRFDDMRDLWRAELHRVEEVLDARLKHLEHE